ncbi:uncharacterized protein BDR25DRAFT_352306 [Lindgomyces ingoldianus]|uniref:Uncharacterized protein n=1 Tax=Lindgomyces ingoldianus TaxID=673940 RepID=A0ACB6R4Y0_9PLEO|nr:uncharacterized protein BDR25DRAFT_352306 [Lindgomyces ingoldianus]KAF2473830.1 hypothetical protein BDR25DRAFT_352306 [Lindgomyces ingoldianus]
MAHTIATPINSVPHDFYAVVNDKFTIPPLIRSRGMAGLKYKCSLENSMEDKSHDLRTSSLSTKICDEPQTGSSSVGSPHLLKQQIKSIDLHVLFPAWPSPPTSFHSPQPAWPLFQPNCLNIHPFSPPPSCPSFPSQPFPYFCPPYGLTPLLPKCFRTATIGENTVHKRKVNPPNQVFITPLPKYCVFSRVKLERRNERYSQVKLFLPMSDRYSNSISSVDCPGLTPGLIYAEGIGRGIGGQEKWYRALRYGGIYVKRAINLMRVFISGCSSNLHYSSSVSTFPLAMPRQLGAACLTLYLVVLKELVGASNFRTCYSHQRENSGTFDAYLSFFSSFLTSLDFRLGWFSFFDNNFTNRDTGLESVENYANPKHSRYHIIGLNLVATCSRRY